MNIRPLKKRVARLSRPVRKIFTVDDATKILNAYPSKSRDEVRQDVERRTPRTRAELASRLSSLSKRVRVSILMPIYESRLDLLSAAIQSVIEQEYTDWELCIVDDGSPSQSAYNLALEYAAQDPRIKVARIMNGGISAATNYAASLATGYALAFLDHDDVLTSDAIGEVAYAYASDNDVDLVYSDDDKIDEAGNRYARQYKPDWSPLTLYSFMYISHLFTVKKALFDQVGGLRSEYDGCQDHDLALRLIPHVKRALHIPKVLYHWRAIPGSTAVSGHEKSATFELGAKAIHEAISHALPSVNANSFRVIRPEGSIKAGTALFWPIFDNSAVDSTYIVYGNKHQIDAWKASNKKLSGVLFFECTNFNDALKYSNSIYSKLNNSVVFIDASLILKNNKVYSDLASHSAIDTNSVICPTLIYKNKIVGAGLTTNSANKLELIQHNKIFGLWANLYAGYTITKIDAFITPLIATHKENIFKILNNDNLNSLNFYNASNCQAHCSSNPLSEVFELLKIKKLLNNKTNALFITHNLNHEGASITLSDIVLGLKNNHDLNSVVISPKNGPLKEAYKDTNIHIDKKISPPTTIEDYEKLQEYIKFIIEKYEIDIVISNTITMNASISAAHSLGVPTILLQHESDCPLSYYNGYSYELKDIFYSAFWKANKVVFVSDSTRQLWSSFNTYKNFMTVRNTIPALANHDDCKIANKRASDRKDKIKIINVGSIGPRKNQIDLINAYYILPDYIKNKLDIHLIGSSNDADYVAKICSKITTYKANDSIMLHYNIEDVQPHYNDADIFVMCSKMESSPRVILEAMRSKCAIITTDVFGIKEITTHMVDALHYTPGDFKTLRNRIVSLIDDSELYSRLVEIAYNKEKSIFSHENMLLKYNEIIHSTAKESTHLN